MRSWPDPAFRQSLRSTACTLALAGGELRICLSCNEFRNDCKKVFLLYKQHRTNVKISSALRNKATQENTSPRVRFYPSVCLCVLIFIPPSLVCTLGYFSEILARGRVLEFGFSCSHVGTLIGHIMQKRCAADYVGG